MTPVMRWLRGAWERHVGTFAEGPEPPARLRGIVELWARANPGATPADWVEFAVLHAEGAYRDGYVRGFERTERLGPDWRDPDEAAAVLEELDRGDVAPVVIPAGPGVTEEQAARAALALYGDFEELRGQRRGPRR